MTGVTPHPPADPAWEPEGEETDAQTPSRLPADSSAPLDQARTMDPRLEQSAPRSRCPVLPRRGSAVKRRRPEAKSVRTGKLCQNGRRIVWRKKSKLQFRPKFTVPSRHQLIQFENNFQIGRINPGKLGFDQFISGRRMIPLRQFSGCPDRPGSLCRIIICDGLDGHDSPVTREIDHDRGKNRDYRGRGYRDPSRRTDQPCKETACPMAFLTIERSI